MRFYSWRLSKWWHVAGSSLVPSSLVTVEQSQKKDRAGGGEGGVWLKRNCTAGVLHHAAVRQRFVTVSDKYRGLWSSPLQLFLCLEGGKGRVTWELPLSSFILAKLALDSQDIKDYCDSIMANGVRWQENVVAVFPVTPQDTSKITQCRPIMR